MQDRPALFSTFLMWLLAELFQELPEVGDLDKPRLVFFFDEAHLLFTDASKDFLTQVTQTVRLIRSKGVGVFFVTQSPKDVPARRARPSWATACSTRCARSPRTTRRRCGPRPGRSRRRPTTSSSCCQSLGHRRGRGHGAVRARAPDAGRVDAAARAAVVDGARCRRRR